MLYFIVLIVVMLLLTTAKLERKKNGLLNFSVILSGLVLILFAGLRSSSVGVDTGNYVGFFRIFNLHAPIFDSEGSKEFGFKILQYVSKSISANYMSFLLTIAFVTVYCYYKTMMALSSNFTISVFLYFTLGVYIFVFNGARQGVAAAIFGLALVSLVHRKLYHYLFWILVASLFHRTVLLMLPFYYILTLKFTMKRMIFFAIISFGALLLLGNILSLFDDYTQDRYGAYEDRGATGGYLLALFYIMMALVLIAFRKYIPVKSQSLYDIYLYLSVFTALVYVVVSLTGSDVNLLRFALYFSYGNILIWPLVLKKAPLFQNPAPRFLFYSINLVFFIVYLIQMSGYVPYYFNPDAIEIFLN